MRWPLIVSMTLGASWIAVANISPFYAMVLIWIMLATALMALFATPRKDRWWAQAPIAVYAGWLTAASFVSVGLVGAGYGVGFGQDGWGFVALAGALAFALAVQSRLGRAPEYGAAVVWALVAVAVSNWGASWGMVVLALIGVVAVGLVAWRSLHSHAGVDIS